MLVLTEETFRVCTALLSTGRKRNKEKESCNSIQYLYFYVQFTGILLTCFDFGGGDGALDVSEDGVDGDGVLGARVKALDHVEVKGVPEVYVLYVAI